MSPDGLVVLDVHGVIFNKPFMPFLAEAALRDGLADMINFGRPLIADPKQVRKQRAAAGKAMKKGGGFVSLNYFILPGFSNSKLETEAFMELIDETRPDFIQLRNLNIDPEWYLSEIGSSAVSPAYGIREWLTGIRKSFPFLRFGYFNPCLNP